MSKSRALQTELYLWQKGTPLRNAYPLEWWSGYRCRKLEQQFDVPANYSTSQSQAWCSGYEYRKEMYG
jgi:hypothetical protein